MLTKNEIIFNFISNLRLASDELKEAINLAANDQLEYLKSDFISRPELKDVTERALQMLKAKRPELYFEFNLDQRKELAPKKLEFASEIIAKDPMNALLYYKFHRKPEFQGLNPGLFSSLIDGLKEYGTSMNTLSDKDGVLFKEIMHLVEQLAKDHPWYYSGNNLADLNSEFAKYKPEIKGKERISYI